MGMWCMHAASGGSTFWDTHKEASGIVIMHHGNTHVGVCVCAPIPVLLLTCVALHHARPLPAQTMFDDACLWMCAMCAVGGW